MENLPEFIKSKLTVLDDHWIWVGAIRNHDREDKKGAVRFNDGMEYAHRVVFHLMTGFDLKSDLQVNHKCGVSLCCNPDHLYAGTQLDNVRDQIRLIKTHCDNCKSLLSTSPTTGHKYCQTCKNQRRNEWRKKQKAGMAKLADAVGLSPTDT